jgi:hypothetical protein
MADGAFTLTITFPRSSPRLAAATSKPKGIALPLGTNPLTDALVTAEAAADAAAAATTAATAPHRHRHHHRHQMNQNRQELRRQRVSLNLAQCWN